jgi:predicted dehydrogenase
MATYSVAFVGTGDPEVGRDTDLVSKDAFAIAYRQAPAYQQLDDVELVACADLVPEHAAGFAEDFDIPAEHAYDDYLEMLAEVDVDVLNVATPAPTHADIVIDAAKAGDLAAIHCQKPMARTWGECLRMTRACEERDVQLTFNHELRYGDPWRNAKDLLDDGEIGDLERIETGVGPLYSMGTHVLDQCGYLNDESAVDWVIGNVDYRQENVFSSGATNENQALTTWRYANGVTGVAATGPGRPFANAFQRLLGTDGVIEVAPFEAEDVDLRVRRAGETEWEVIDCGEGSTGGFANGYPYMIDAMRAVIEGLETGERPEIGAHNALKSTEIIFATYESARKRGRVDLPLEITDNPLEAMVESGALDPAPEPETDDEA